MQGKMGFHAVIKTFAGLGLILAAVTYWLIPPSTRSSTTPIKLDLKEVLTNRRVILTCLFAGFMVGPLEGFADVWGTLFLKQNYQLSTTLSSTLPSMIFIGMCVGAPILTYLADKVGNYFVIILASGVSMLGCFFMLLTWKLSINIITINFLIMGVACAYQILAIYKASTYVPTRVAGFATALANTIIMIFGYGFHATIGSIVNKAGGISSSKALITGLAVIPLSVLIGSIGFARLLIKEKNKKIT
jgi:MFS family permease